MTSPSSLPLIAPPPPTDWGKDRRRKPESRASERRSRDRRASPRLAVELECEEQIGHSRYFRITWDLSAFGLSTRYGYPHPVGTKLKLALYLPDDPEPVRLRAQVVGLWPENSGVRLAFRSPPADAVRRINRYLRSRAT